MVEQLVGKKDKKITAKKPHMKPLIERPKIALKPIHEHVHVDNNTPMDNANIAVIKPSSVGEAIGRNDFVLQVQPQSQPLVTVVFEQSSVGHLRTPTQSNNTVVEPSDQSHMVSHGPQTPPNIAVADSLSALVKHSN